MKVLLIRVSSMGDVLHNMPIVADIHAMYPDAQIDWVVEESFVDLVRLNGGVRKVIPFALRRWRKHLLSAETRAEMASFRSALQSETYDLVLETQGLLKTGLIMGLARARHKVGLANGTEGSGYEALSRWFHDQSVTVPVRAHAVLRGRLVAAEALGYRDRLEQLPVNFGLRAPAAANADWLPPSEYVVFFHGTAGERKKWPAHDWISLGKALQARGLALLLPWGSTAEQVEARQLAEHIPGAMLLPKLSMIEAVRLAERAALVIGVDTGLTHIAAAYCRPTIELYLASPRWKTEGNWSDRIINLGDSGQAPTVAQVLDAVQRLRPVTA